MPGTSQAVRGLDHRAAFVTAALLASVAGPAAAQARDSKYWIEVSAYRPSIDTNATVSRPGQPGTDIDFEQELDLNKHETLPAVYAGARLGGRWIIAGEYYALDRNGTNTLSRDIVFDSTIYPANATVEAKMRSDIYRVTVGYSFIQNDRAQAGAAIGLHATNFEIGIEGQVNVGGAGFSTERRRTDFVAPLPTLGVYGDFAVTDKVTLSGRADYLSLKVGDYDGSILNAQAAIAYRVYNQIELGIAYRYVDYSLDVEKNTYTVDLDYKFSGPSVFFRIGFK